MPLEDNPRKKPGPVGVRVYCGVKCDHSKNCDRS